MKTIGIKLADGSFYPVLEDNTPSEKKLELTTAHNNQTKVMVDLYRSATCSMEDAEYVDSLQIENLNARPNGEPEIKFTVSLDEDNQLSAKIVDSETGNESNTTITLVSRTLEERLVTDEYDINDSKESGSGTKAAVAGAVATGGLLAAAAALRNKNLADETKEEDTEVTEPEPIIEEPEVETIEEEAPIEDETFVDEPVIEEPIAEEITTEAEPVFDEAPVEESTVDEINIDETIDDTVFEETPAEESNDNEPVIEEPAEDFAIDEPATEEETTEDISSELSDMDFDLPDDTENTVVEPVETTAELDNSDELADMSFDLPDDTESTEVTETSDELPDMDFDLPDDTENTVVAVPEPVEEGETTADADDSDDTTLSDDTFNFDDTESTDATVSEDDTFSSDDTISADDTISDDDTLPDMDFDIPDDTTETEPQMPDDFFNTDDLDKTEDTMDDPIFDTNTPATGGLNFDGLYDEETERGTPAQNDEDDVKKKTKVPVIICIVCAIICILATLLILFIIPSKYNLITKKHAKESVVAVAPATEPSPAPVVEPEPEPEPAVPEAKEDEIIIIEKAEEVVPSQPPVAEEKPKNITYKIKWGDTLWDIADTYYKNPWRYKYIARYNGIRNPDYIISGTIITIPAQ